MLEAPVRTYGKVVLKANTKVGKFTLINASSTLFQNSQIGRFCSIGKNCEIGALDHPTQWLSTSPVQHHSGHFPCLEGTVQVQTLKQPVGPVIGNDVWIGSSVLIKRGVTIGDGAIVGANSLVNKDVPPYAIVEGTPAKRIGSRFPKGIVDKLLALRWWDMNIEDLSGLDFADIKGAIAKLESIKNKNAPPASPAKPRDRSTHKGNITPLTTSAKRKQSALTAIGKVTTEKANRRADPAFVEMLQNKMEQGNLSPVVIQFIVKNSKSIFTNYNWDDTRDIAILNNKILFIAERYNYKFEKLTDIKKVDRDLILNTFKSRH
jgi:acetyltransferase-like isoleucine patch superfamily enzyme